MDKMKFKEKEFNVIKLLGKGKGGYSYLVEDEEHNQFVLKKIHHEPCSYYSFPKDKLSLELNDYKRLSCLGLAIPKLLDFDKKEDAILKEYIEGPTIESLVKNGKMKEDYIKQVEEMANILKMNNLNIDYYPTNFIVQNEKIYYIDFECNDYHEEWSFEVWGKQYWK
ncbi:MAG: hypothetical protein ACI311_03450 [Bacilli bacterium]